MIKLNNLNKYFNAGKKNEIHVLNDITLSLPDKGLVMFLGASGSGKTTLLNVIGGLDKIKRGSIYFEEEEISKFNISKWDELRNESIGYIFQNYYLQPQLSVFDNVAFVLKMIGITDAEEINTRVSYILKALGMYEYRKKKALQLSGGQQQRVAIARALVKNPSIIIADEPTGNLDSKNTADIMNIIQAIAKEKLVVLVTHENELAQFYADRIIEISDGKITSDVLNTQSLHHGLVDEQTIYLKDLTNETTLESSKLDVNFYSDKEIDHKIKVDVIFKNNTLYLKVDSNYKNIKLTNDQEGIEIKNEHFVKKSREQLLETTYDTNFLDHKHIKKERKFVISAKRNVKIALGKILSFGRKGKLMIASFVLAGTVIAFALSMLFTALVINPVTPYEKDTLRIETNLPISNNATYSQFKEIVGNDKFIFHTSASLTLDIAGFGNNELRKSGNIIINETSTAKIKYGRDIRSNNEVLISIGLANDFINRESGFLGSMSISGNDFGLWEYSDLFNEDFSLTMASNSPTKIVGIKDNNEKAIYINEALYLEHLNMNGNQTLESAYENATTIIIFSTNKNNVVNNLTNTNIVDMYQQAYDNSKENNTSLLPTLLPIVSIFLGFTFIGFYFVIRSSMISRIQEIGIYRALGVKRIEIISMFFFEIVILTTISTLIGYFLGFLLVRSLASSLLGQLNMFATNGFSFVLGITLVYAFNILAGLLPVFLLLNKTPAQILTQYDI